MSGDVMRAGGIYAIRCSGNGRTYVGSAVVLKARWKAHRSALTRGDHRNARLQRAWQKYGPEMFSFDVLEKVEDPSRLIQCEQAWIDVTPGLFNLSPTAGSHLGIRRSDETKRKMSLALKGKRPSPETMAAAKAFRTGRPHSEETKARMSAAHKGRPKPPMSAEARAKISAAQRGKRRVFTPEHRERLAEAARRRFRDPEQRERLSSAKKGVKFSPEVRAKMSEAQTGKLRSLEQKERHSLAMRAWWKRRKENVHA